LLSSRSRRDDAQRRCCQCAPTKCESCPGPATCREGSQRRTIRDTRKKWVGGWWRWEEAAGLDVRAWRRERRASGFRDAGLCLRSQLLCCIFAIMLLVRNLCDTSSADAVELYKMRKSVTSERARAQSTASIMAICEYNGDFQWQLLPAAGCLLVVLCQVARKAFSRGSQVVENSFNDF